MPLLPAGRARWLTPARLLTLAGGLLLAALTAAARQSDDDAPRVVAVSPAPGIVTGLRQIMVMFDRPVTGVAAGDFLVNGSPATQMAGSGSRYTFSFAQPAFGTVGISWGTFHQIRDFGTPSQFFSVTGPGASWSYELIDVNGPEVSRRQPPAGITVRHLREVEVTFNRAVRGVIADDLLLNGTSAEMVSGFGAGPYRFVFTEGAPAGPATLSWRPEHEIVSEEPLPQPFRGQGQSWACQVDPVSPPHQVVLNEFVAENQSGRRDEDQDPEDWIELHNQGDTPAALAGWAIGTRRDPQRAWTFPAVTIPARGFLRLWASAKDRPGSGGGREAHTNFKLNPTGGTLRLFGPELPREMVDSVDYGPQGADYAYGRQGDGSGLGSEWRYFAVPTPGASNGSSTLTGIVAPVHFSAGRGFYDTPFQLSLACATPGVVIRYTTNGSAPTATEGQVYHGPILINANRVVRAIATREDRLPSGVETHTYLYGLMPRHRALPALSLVTATNHLYGRTGIMEYNPRNTDKHGPAWERPVSVEYIRPEDNTGFHVNAGLRIQGGGYIRSRYNYRSGSLPESKYSFRLYFRGEYGAGRLRYPLFPGTTVDSFDTIVLRAGMNDPSNPFIKDELCRQLSSDLGMAASHGTFVHLFLNGVYRGYYNPVERIDDDFLRDYHGGGEDWDLIASMSELREGDKVSWNQLLQLAQTAPATDEASYRRYLTRLDVTNFVDYLLMPIYADVDDWPHNNWRAARERTPSGLWRFYAWDVEWSFGDPNGHGVSFNTITGQLSSLSPPWGGTEIARLFNSLKSHPEFRLLFADRVHRAFYNGGALTDDQVRGRYEEIKARMRVGETIPGFRNSLISNWIVGRRRHVIAHLERAGFHRSTNAPGFAPFGGVVPAGHRLTLTNLEGAIYYTTDGSDPRVPFSGAVAPTAAVYTAPVVLDRAVRLRARSLAGDQWSALTEAEFGIGGAGVPVRITELNYNPPGGDAHEFIELTHTGTAPVDLSGFRFEGVDFRFATPFPVLEPRTRLVLASATQPAAFAAHYPGVAVAGYFGGALSNGGERIALLDREGRVVDSVTYDDEGAWDRAADGDGPSLELITLTGDPEAPSSWQSSRQPGGTPGAPNAARSRPSIELNEVAALVQGNDWIELSNRGSEAVALGGWSLTDAPANPRRFVFPSGITLPPGAFLQITAAATPVAGGGLNTGFALNAAGESLALFDAATNVVDSVVFGAQARGYTLGRTGPDGDWTLCNPTPGAANEPATAAPATSLVLNELMANDGNTAGWIELHNRAHLPAVVTGSSIAVSNGMIHVRSPVFVEPGGFAVFQAPGGTGPARLGFPIPASGGLVTLSDPSGLAHSEVAYGPQVPGVSVGRLPDGDGDWNPLPFSATPGASNFLAAPGRTLRFSELMAHNAGAVTAPGGATADWVEIENASESPLDLTGHQVRLQGHRAWTFPRNSVMASGERRVLWATGDRLPDGTPNLGISLPELGGTLELLDPVGRLLDQRVFGFQLPDQSVGLTPDGWRLMERPTPGADNAVAAPLGDVQAVRINEWLAVSTPDPEWFELINPQSLPVDLGGCYLTDDPSRSGATRFEIVPLSLVPAGGYVRFFADNRPDRGPDHVNFRLNQLGESIRLSAPDRTQVDAVHFGVQALNLSEGRVPDGTPRILRLPVPTPLEPNVPPDFDFDGDGLPDAWELTFGFDPDNSADATEDADGDGQTNLAEFVAGTDPRDPASVLALRVNLGPGDGITLRFTAVNGRTYRLHRREALDESHSWELVDEVSAGDADRELEVSEAPPRPEGTAQLYRLQVR